MTTKAQRKKIERDLNKYNSILNIARKYNLTVEEVTDIFVQMMKEVKK